MIDNNSPIITRINNIIDETSSTKTYILEYPENFIFQSGQYITINNSPLNTAKARSYSISSAAYERELSITIKRQDNGYFSRLMHDNAKIGDTINIIGVNGKFTLPNDIEVYSEYIFFAAGSGIVPIFALIKDLLHHKYLINIHLYYSNHSKDDSIFYNELEILKNSHNNFKIQYYFSNNVEILKARFSPFEIPYILNQKDLNKTIAYICGPIDYMDSIKITLLAYQIPQQNIYVEEYNIYDIYDEENVITPPVDKNPHMVTFVNDNVHKSITVQYPKSILQTALENNIFIPYSCNSGQCGSCALKLVKGEVWLGYNATLTDKDIKNGITLTCQGFPINGDVILSLE